MNEPRVPRESQPAERVWIAAGVLLVVALVVAVVILVTRDGGDGLPALDDPDAQFEDLEDLVDSDGAATAEFTREAFVISCSQEGTVSRTECECMYERLVDEVGEEGIDDLGTDDPEMDALMLDVAVDCIEL